MYASEAAPGCWNEKVPVGSTCSRTRLDIRQLTSPVAFANRAAVEVMSHAGTYVLRKYPAARMKSPGDTIWEGFGYNFFSSLLVAAPFSCAHANIVQLAMRLTRGGVGDL